MQPQILSAGVGKNEINQGIMLQRPRHRPIFPGSQKADFLRIAADRIRNQEPYFHSRFAYAPEWRINEALHKLAPFEGPWQVFMDPASLNGFALMKEVAANQVGKVPYPKSLAHLPALQNEFERQSPQIEAIAWVEQEPLYIEHFGIQSKRLKDGGRIPANVEGYHVGADQNLDAWVPTFLDAKTASEYTAGQKGYFRPVRISKYDLVPLDGNRPQLEALLDLEQQGLSTQIPYGVHLGIPPEKLL